MKRKVQKISFKKVGITAVLLLSSVGIFAQTNVYDDVIANSANHTSLAAALQQEGLDVALQNSAGTFTVFAPDNMAFDNLAAALGTDITGLLALPELSDILTYHVLATTVPASGVTNGAIVTPLNSINTLKLTATSTGDVYVNQAMVNAADLNADNGVVHSVNAVLLPRETVVDVAIDNGFASLTAAVVTAELLPALTDPLADYTVFAPTDMAFDNLATALGTDINGLLALPILSDILLYHVIGTSVNAADINNGDLADVLNTSNTVKLTKTSGGMVFANQAEVVLADVASENGVVHAVDAVLLPYETVVDVAIDNGFTTLTAAVIEAELLPALTNPLGTFTVFAPTNAAFDNLASDLGTDLNGLLALPNLADVLLYHTIGSIVNSGDLMNGPVTTLSGGDVVVDLTMGVMINDATVTMADVTAENGVVHVIDKVLLDATASVNENELEGFNVFPNPAVEFINVEVENSDSKEVSIVNNIGQVVKVSALTSGQTKINVLDLEPGNYTLVVRSANSSRVEKLVITSVK